LTKSLCGRAELIRALAQDDVETTQAMADLLGYRVRSRDEQAPVLPLPRSALQPLTGPEPPETADVEDTSGEPEDVRFWRVARFESVAQNASGDKPPERTFVAWRRRPTTAPGFTPLVPRHMVLTRLRQVVATRHSSRDIDEEAAVKQISRACFLDDLPRRERRAWGAGLVVVKDRSKRLTPYWQDQAVMVDALSRLYPHAGSRL
jgi:hypothetical protein